MKVYIGFDAREAAAATVAAKSLREVTRGQIEPEFLSLPKLVDQGLLTRPFDRRGRSYDLISGESFSTDFKFTRFLTPVLAQQGFALFVDCDVVFLRDPRVMLDTVQAHHAVSVVKHEQTPAELLKMDGQEQKRYPRKNWSSVMLFNADHPANRRLSLHDVNSRPAQALHSFYWLHDDEIGTLAPQWNWLVDVQPRPAGVGIAHMTLGGPWLPGWQGGSFDEEWKMASI